MLKTAIVSIVASGLVVGTAQAQTLKPVHASMIDIGPAHGSAYYMPEAGGYHVVATLDTGTATPIRFGATLQQGQSAMVSVPTNLGQPAMEIVFSRVADTLEVHQSNIPSDAVTASTR